MFSQQYEYKTFNTSINSRYAELGVTYIDANNVIFASSKKTNQEKNFNKNPKSNNQQLYVDLYKGVINEDGDIIQSKRLTNDIDNMFYVSDITFSKNLKSTYFTWNNFYNSTSKKDSEEWKTLHIVKANVNSNLEVSNIKNVPFNSNDYSVMQPQISADGKQLYFVSDMPNGYGYTDIYVVDINSDGTYGKPRNLGPNVNTDKTESFPFIDSNNTLYFSSYGHNSKGGFDIFKSEFKNGNFKKATTLPSPINTKSDDFAFVIDTNKKSGFFTSARRGGKGDADIYGFNLVEKEIKCIQFISGLVLNKKMKLSNASVSLYNDENKLISSITTLKNGRYIFEIECNKNYKIIVEKEHFTSLEYNFDTNDKDGFEIDENLQIKELECNQTIKGLVTNINTKEVLKNKTIKLLKKGKVVKTIKSLEDGSFKFDLECFSQYLLVTDNIGFSPSEIKIKTTSNFGEAQVQNIELTPQTCSQFLITNLVNKNNGEPLINSTIKLIENDKIIRTEKLNNTSTFKFKLNCNKTYKLLINKTDFEPIEIEFTTKDKDNLELTRTIELTPVDCNQLITGTVFNKETDESISNVKVTLYKNDELVGTQIIEGNNKYSFKLKCNETYKIMATNKDYKPYEKDFNTDNKNNFTISQNLALDPLDCNQLVTITVIHKLTKESLNNITLKLSQKGKVIQTENITDSKKINFQLECNSIYVISAEKRGFESTNLEINTSILRYLKFSESIELAPCTSNQIVSGTIINSNTKNVLKDVKVTLYRNNEIVDSKNTNSKGIYKFNVSCDENYKIIVEKDEFKSAEISFSTNNKPDFNNTQNISLIPFECNQQISISANNKLTNDALTNVLVKLILNDKTIKTENIGSSKKINFKLECNKLYKITAQKDGFKTAQIDLATSKEHDSEFDKLINLEPISCNQLVTGTIKNSNTSELLNNVKIILYKNNEIIDSQIINSKGEYSFNVVCDENYKIVAEKDEFKSSEISFSTKNKPDFTNTQNISLIPFECNQQISISANNKLTDVALTNVVLKLFLNGKAIKTQNIGSAQKSIFKLECNKPYKITAQKDGFKTVQIDLTTSKERDLEFEKLINLEPIPCNQFISGTVKNSTTTELLSNVKVILYKNNEEINSQIINSKDKYNFNVVCNENYKIVAEKDGFENAEIKVSTDSTDKNKSIKNILLKPIICNQFISGVIIDEQTNIQLNNLQVSLFKNDIKTKSLTVNNKKFNFVLECNSNYYLLVEKANYKSSKIEITTSETLNQKIEKSIILTPLKCSQIAKGKVIDNLTKLPIPNTKINIFNEENKIKSISADENGSFETELECNLSYSIKISATNYKTFVWNINKVSKFNITSSKTILLVAEEVFELAENIKSIKTKPIYFDLDNSDITEAATVELEKVIATLKKYPTLKIQVNLHTDSRAPDGYNLQLSEDRAQSIVKYIISTGIDSSRITGEGFGETKLLNKCSNGVRCTEAEHQLNRRTEFIVIP